MSGDTATNGNASAAARPPKLSVVLPVYNGAASIGETLASIAAQSESDFELLVIDDGSTDATPRLLADAAARDKRIRVITQPNGGITRALIRGCEEARAPIIARHDCGDVSKRERFARALELLARSSRCVVAACEVDYVGPGGEPLYGTSHASRDIRAALLHGAGNSIFGLPHHGSAVFRADAYRRAGGYRAEFYFAQDLDLWIRMAPLGDICIDPSVQYVARIGVQTISSRHRQAQVALTEIAVALRDTDNDTQRTALLQQAAAVRPTRTSPRSRDDAKALYFIAACLHRRGDGRWKGYAAKALRRNLLHLRAWLLFVRPRRRA